MHWVFSSFSFPRKLKWSTFFKPCKVPTMFDILHFGHSSKHLSADRLRHEHKTLRIHHVYFCQTCFVLVDWRTCGKFITKQIVFSCNPLHTLQESHSQNFASWFSPATIWLASFHKRLKSLYRPNQPPEGSLEAKTPLQTQSTIRRVTGG